MKRVPLVVGVIAAVALPIAALRSWPRATSPKPQAASASAARVWTCSMHPQVRLPGPGRCPICGMNLVPAHAFEAEKAPKARSRPSSMLQTEPAARRALFREIRTVGKLDYNERTVAYISARVAGRVERLYADFTGIPVKAGDHLAEIYSPALYTAQSELLLALDDTERARASPGGLPRNFSKGVLDAARLKLRLWGITQEQLDQIERTRKIQTYLTIYAPIGGTIVEKAVREGQYVKEGDLLYRVASLDPIWLYLDIYEYDINWVRYGQAVDVALEAFPGQAFRGTVVFIEPFLDDQTRTLKVRVNLRNPSGALKPAMYASAVIRVELQADASPAPTGLEGKYWCPMHPDIVRDGPGRCPLCQMPLEKVPRLGAGQPETHVAGAMEHETGAVQHAKVLSIPATAVLDTGRRKIAFRAKAGGGYELVEVQVGPLAEAQDEGPSGRQTYYPVLGGLKEGDPVVVRGGFLLDSQRQIEGMPSLLYPEGQSAASLHSGHGMAPSKAPGTAVHQH